MSFIIIFTIAMLIDVRWYLSLVLISIFWCLVTKEFFMYLLAICENIYLGAEAILKPGY